MAFSYIIYWTLIQNIIMFCFHAVSFTLLLRFFNNIKKMKHTEISAPFLVYLFTVIINATLGLINSAYVIYVWWNGTNSAIIIYITTAAVISIFPLSSLSVFFLIIHRILVINKYFSKTKIHQWLLTISIISMILFTIISVAYYSWIWTLIEQPAPNNCWSVNCVTRFNGSIFSVYSKLVGGFFNAIVGIWFLYELKKSQKQSIFFHQPSNKLGRKKANKLTLLTIILEVVLNFVPAVIDLVLRSTINFALTQYIGVYGMFFASADGLFVSVFYSKSYGKLKTITSSNATTMPTSKISVLPARN